MIYEMATGRKAFDGKSQASLIAAIMKREPPPISTVQPVAPPALDHVVRILPGQRVRSALADRA